VRASHGVGGNILDAFVELAAKSLHEVADEEGKIPRRAREEQGSGWGKNVSGG